MGQLSVSSLHGLCLRDVGAEYVSGQTTQAMDGALLRDRPSGHTTPARILVDRVQVQVSQVRSALH